MLSICIPVYNFDIELLLRDLTNLVGRIPIACEILVVDDCSENNLERINNKISQQFGVRYISLPENIGRSAIRNFLCKESTYPNLLFLDCDSKIVSADFIKNYRPFLNQNVVVYGGTVYQALPPHKSYRLHWRYGLKREIKPVSERNLHPSKYFKTNNFLIPKEVLLKLPFNEKLKAYGHEDTLMAIAFSQNEIRVNHIDNPVLHSGLETNKVFITKTETGIRNLAIIKNMVNDQEILGKYIRLLKIYHSLERYRLSALFSFFWLLSKPLLLFLIKNFYLLKVFDIYKLGYLCSINQKSTTFLGDAFSGKLSK